MNNLSWPHEGSQDVLWLKMNGAWGLWFTPAEGLHLPAERCCPFEADAWSVTTCQVCFGYLYPVNNVFVFWFLFC